MVTLNLTLKQIGDMSQIRAADLTVFPKRFIDGSKPFSNRKPLKPFNGLTVQTENGLTVLTENRSNWKSFKPFLDDNRVL